MKNLKYVLLIFVMFFISLSRVEAKTECYYKVTKSEPDFYIICSVTTSDVSCRTSIGRIKIEKSSINFKDFVEQDTLVCPDYVYIDLYLEDNNKSDKVHDVIIVKNFKSSSDINYIKVKKDIHNTIEGKDKFGNDDKDNNQSDTSNNGTSSNKPNSENSTTNTSNESDLDLENFCQGPVQGAFTTLGWVFFILKILIPIILIVFGCIDFFKAMVSGQASDEMKKSVKSLILRCVAGIAIFFIPTVLNFVVSLIDKDKVYNGDFADCTKCMLDPDDNCSGLGGK